MPSDGWFRRKSIFPQTAAARNSASVPDGVALKCARCGQILFTSEFEKNLKVCPHCGFHHKLTGQERIAWTADTDSFSPLFENLRSRDPLHFDGYAGKLEKATAATKEWDGVTVGAAKIGGVSVILGVMDFAFMGASMGSVAGEKITRALEEGERRHCPVVIFTASGGARMQEGLLSLMQMAKTAAAAKKLDEARQPYIVVMTDPTMAGVAASFASLGDVIFAEPEATIGFAGARVAAQASHQKPPADYQTSEWQLAHGQIDAVVTRRDLPTTLANLLQMLASKSARPAQIFNGAARNGTHSAESHSAE